MVSASAEPPGEEAAGESRGWVVAWKMAFPKSVTEVKAIHLLLLAVPGGITAIAVL